MWNTIGHEKNKKYFETVLKTGSSTLLTTGSSSPITVNALSHAYIFSGPAMIGKKMFAQDLYRLVNKKEEIRDSDFDFKLIRPRLAEDETKIYIEDIREIKSFLSLRPNIGPYKFVIIDDAHCITPEGTNALLKVLEEPPSFSILVLVTSMPKLLPQTITSRCQTVRFLPQEKETADFIKSKKFKKNDEEFLIKMSNGRIGWVVRMTDSANLKEARKSVDDLQKLLQEGTFERMMYAKKSYENKNYLTTVDYWLDWLHGDMASGKSKNILKELLKLRQLISQPQYNHRLALENFLINL